MSEHTVKIGLVGFGTVGSGVAKILLEDADRIAEKIGVRLELACVVDKDTTSERPIKLPAGLLTDDLDTLLSDASIDIAVELVGGTDFAKDLQTKLLAAGKHVVTANKALLAEHGSELYRIARENNKCIAFEASCAGGIPIISAIRTGLAANTVEGMYGIVNGTCNYILSSMTEKNESFATALKEAQDKGFAEADPTLDISGGDSAHKLAIMSAMAFGYEIDYEDVYVEGIESISIDDIRYGGEMGYVLKLLAIGQRLENGKILLGVHPSFIAKDTSLARVSGSFNAVCLFGSAVGEVMFYGRGAGMMPTASAVVADIIETALGNSQKTFEKLRLRPHDEFTQQLEPIDNSSSRFYVRLAVKDQAGVFAQIGQILADHEISISGVLQHEGRGPDNTVPVVITTHPNLQSKVSAAVKDLDALDTICGEPVCIRIVSIPEDRD